MEKWLTTRKRHRNSTSKSTSDIDEDNLEEILNKTVIPAGIDPDFLAAIPPELRVEMISDHETQKALLIANSPNTSPKVTTPNKRPIISSPQIRSQDTSQKLVSKISFVSTLQDDQQPCSSKTLAQKDQESDSIEFLQSITPQKNGGKAYSNSTQKNTLQDCKALEKNNKFVASDHTLLNQTKEMNEEIRMNNNLASKNAQESATEQIREPEHSKYRSTPVPEAENVDSRPGSVITISSTSSETDANSREVPTNRILVPETQEIRSKLNPTLDKMATDQDIDIVPETLEAELIGNYGKAPATSKNGPENNVDEEPCPSLGIALSQLFSLTSKDNITQKIVKKPRVYKWALEKAALEQQLKEKDDTIQQLLEKIDEIKQANLQFKEEYEKKLESNQREMELEVAEAQHKYDSEHIKRLKAEIENKNLTEKYKDAHTFCKELVKSQNNQVKSFFEAHASNAESSDEDENLEIDQRKRKRRRKIVQKI